MKILLVDSDETAISVVLETLNDAKYAIIVAVSIQEAKRILELDASSIALIICDTALKSETNEDLLDLLISNPKFKHIPVAVCSNFQSTELIRVVKKKGANDLIAKPIDPFILKQKVERIITARERIVLIVDDDEFIRDILKLTFEREGYHIDTAENAEVALSILESNPFDIIVSDILMPGMDGIELMTIVKVRYPHIPVLLITGYSGSYDRKSAIAHGADGFITKPFKNTEILSLTKSLI